MAEDEYGNEQVMYDDAYYKSTFCLEDVSTN